MRVIVLVFFLIALILLKFQSTLEYYVFFFLSSTKNKQYLDASKKLQELVYFRPEDNGKTESIVTFTEALVSEESESIQKEPKDKNQKFNQGQYPFTKHFESIYEDVKKSIEDSAQFDPNYQASPEFIEFLLNKYLPYCFIWAGFVFKGLRNTTRVTNGSIEKFFATKKSVIKKAVLPHVYVNTTFDTTIGYTTNFMKLKLKKQQNGESQWKQIQMKKMKSMSAKRIGANP